MKHLLLMLIRIYQRWISPCLGGSHCRFTPSCSCYAHEAIEKHGCIKALFLITKRLLKCGPWHPGGHDPVP